MSKQNIPLPEVKIIHCHLIGELGRYFLTDAGCLFMPNFIDIEDMMHFDSLIYQAPPDTILCHPLFQLMYRTGYYPSLLESDDTLALLECPTEVKWDTPPLRVQHMNPGTGRGKIFDLDAEIAKEPILETRLQRRTGISSGPF